MYPSHPSTQFYYLFVQKKNKKKTELTLFTCRKRAKRYIWSTESSSDLSLTKFASEHDGM